MLVTSDLQKVYFFNVLHLKLVVSNLSSLSSTNSDVLCLQYSVLNVIAELHEFMTYFQIDSGFLQLSLQMYFF